MPTLLQQNTVYASVENKGGSIGRRVDNSTFLSVVCPPATADGDLWGKNASVLHLCVDISALTFGTNTNVRPLAQSVHGVDQVAVSTKKRCFC